MKAIKHGTIIGLSAGIVFCGFVGVTLLMAQTLNSFKPGDIVSSSSINDNFTALKNRVAPVGGIVAWHKDMISGQALTEGWVECNGQTINDPESPYNGMIAPNLNGDAGGADSPDVGGKYRMFLRGDTTSGTGTLDAFQGHHHAGSDVHDIPGDAHLDASLVASGIWWNRFYKGDPTTGNHGAARVDTETRPVNMTVVWVMRIK